MTPNNNKQLGPYSCNKGAIRGEDMIMLLATVFPIIWQMRRLHTRPEAGQCTTRLDLLRDPADHSRALALGAPEPGLKPQKRSGGRPDPIGVTDEVVMMANGSAYPVVDSVPVMLRPERLAHDGDEPSDLDDSPVAEACEDARAQSARVNGATTDKAKRSLRRIYSDVDPMSFPYDIAQWVESGIIGGPYAAAMSHIGPVEGEVVLQLGGIGSQALRLIRAGAEHAVVVSPVVSELLRGVALARAFGVSDQLTFVAGVAEELPLGDSSVSVVYAESTMHHTRTEAAFPEVARVLRPGGRYASIDVWQGRSRRVAARAFAADRDGRVCRPLDGGRVRPALESLNDVSVSHHGCLVRHPLAAMARVGIELPPAMGLKVSLLEDAVPLGPLTKSLASIVCIRGTG